MSALYTSIKVNERVAIGSDTFAVITNGVYSMEEIEAMEATILKGIDWRIFAPTSLQIAHHAVALSFAQVNIDHSIRSFLMDEIGLQVEIATRDYYFTLKRRSTVAMAAVLNALVQVDHKVCHDALYALLPIIEHFAHPSELAEAKNRLQSLLLNRNWSLEEERVFCETGKGEYQSTHEDGASLKSHDDVAEDISYHTKRWD